LRKGDADFEGYISNGDLNQNGLIDAYDISNVAVWLNGGIEFERVPKVEGKLDITADKRMVKKGETVKITVKGVGLKSVNALSFALPYNASDFEYESVEATGTKAMENMTNDRLHKNGDKVLYPTFVNVGNQEMLNGDETLFVLKFKALKDAKFDLKTSDGILVDKRLNMAHF
jgi:hypothetical protein